MHLLSWWAPSKMSFTAAPLAHANVIVEQWWHSLPSLSLHFGGWLSFWWLIVVYLILMSIITQQRTSYHHSLANSRKTYAEISLLSLLLWLLFLYFCLLFLLDLPLLPHPPLPLPANVTLLLFMLHVVVIVPAVQCPAVLISTSGNSGRGHMPMPCPQHHREAWYCINYGKVNVRKCNWGNSRSSPAILGKGSRLELMQRQISAMGEQLCSLC